MLGEEISYPCPRPEQVGTPCEAPSAREGNNFLHLLAVRGWRQFGAHNWTLYEQLCRTACEAARNIPKDKGLDLRNTRQMTPLMSAAAIGNDELAFELVKSGASVNLRLRVQGKPARTAMDLAACGRNLDILEDLKRHGGRGLCEERHHGGGFQQRGPQRGKKSRRKG